MMIIKPTDTDHTLKVIPRFFPCKQVTLNIKDTTTGMDASNTVNYREVGGKLSFDFSLTCIDETRYQLTLSEGEEIIYRGVAIATSQESQEYQLTKNKYYY